MNDLALLADVADKAVEHLSNMYAQLRPETDPLGLRLFVMFEMNEDNATRVFLYPQPGLRGTKDEIIERLVAGYELAVLCVMADEYLWKAGPGYEEHDAKKLIDSAVNGVLSASLHERRLKKLLASESREAKLLWREKHSSAAMKI